MQNPANNPSNIGAMDMQARAYFDSMPQALKSQIVESGAKLCTKEELSGQIREALDWKRSSPLSAAALEVLDGKPQGENRHGNIPL